MLHALLDLSWYWQLATLVVYVAVACGGWFWLVRPRVRPFKKMRKV